MFHRYLGLKYASFKYWPYFPESLAEDGFDNHIIIDRVLNLCVVISCDASDEGWFMPENATTMSGDLLSGGECAVTVSRSTDTLLLIRDRVIRRFRISTGTAERFLAYLFRDGNPQDKNILNELKAYDKGPENARINVALNEALNAVVLPEKSIRKAALCR